MKNILYILLALLMFHSLNINATEIISSDNQIIGVYSTNTHATDQNETVIAPYFHEFLRLTLTAKEPKPSDYSEWNKQQYQLDKWQWENNPLYGFCEKNKKPDGTNYDIYKDGLKIYATIDSHMQRYAEEAVSEHMQAQEKSYLRCGFMSMDPFTGHVKAYIGGPNFANSQYDMCTKGRRQVGSTIMPFLYTLAMDKGMWPCEKRVFEPITLKDGNGNEWTPRDMLDRYKGDTVTLTWGLQNSSNWISAYLMSLFTPKQLVQLMRSFGMQGQLEPIISIFLGPSEVSLEEMVDAYTTFVNKGIRTEPLYVTHIEDSNGNVIANFTPHTKKIISETTSYKMIHMLRAVMDYGTGMRLRFKYGIKAQMGAGSGNTKNNSDGWFLCFTPSLVNGAWVGREDRNTHSDNMAAGQGATMALPICAIYMQKIYADPNLGYSQTEQFDIPEWFDPNAGCK